MNPPTQLGKLMYYLVTNQHQQKERRHPDSNWGIGVLQTRALPLGYVAIFGADDEARTRYLNLGKVALYQMSYIRVITDSSSEIGRAHV